jgi:hypothetical protein
MRRLQKPTLQAIDVFDGCLTGIADQELANRFLAARPAINAQFLEYEVKAAAHALDSFVPCEWGKKEQIVVGDLRKSELVDLYSSQMANKKGEGRPYYDQLMMLAPLGICPFCGFGHASTLDHFLSKAFFPTFSVLSVNLIPACKDCNTGKGASAVGPNEQTVHPYFENEIIDTDAWLFAEVLQTRPATIRYYVNTPVTWPLDLSNRIVKYFKELDLARRFSVQASPEIIEISELMDMLVSLDTRRAHLATMAQIERTKRKNSWKAPMYEALAASDWYLAAGYRNVPL